MAVSRDIKYTNYCEGLYGELEGMRAKVFQLIEDTKLIKGFEEEHLNSHLSHLRDIANTIEWKRDVMMKACPGDWTKQAKDVESTVSVRVGETLGESESFGGFAGG